MATRIQFRRAVRTLAIAAIFVAMQLLAAFHGAVHGDQMHEHDGKICAVQILSETGKAMAPAQAPEAGPVSYPRHAATLPVAAPFSLTTRFPPFHGRAPPGDFS